MSIKEFRFNGISQAGQPVQGTVFAPSSKAAKKRVESLAERHSFRTQSIEQRATFMYKFKHLNGKVIEGEQKAFSEDELKTALSKMGVEPFLIAYAINLVVAQRLIRVVCPDCKEVDENPDRTMMAGLGFTEEEMDNNTFYKANEGGHKCPNCNGRGYKGRRAVCETLYFTPAIRTLVAESGEAIDEDAIKEQAIKDGMLTLADSARVLVNMGETTVDEMMRMTSSG